MLKKRALYTTESYHYIRIELDGVCTHGGEPPIILIKVIIAV